MRRLLPPEDVADGEPVPGALSRLAARLDVVPEAVRQVWRGRQARSEATFAAWERRLSA